MFRVFIEKFLAWLNKKPAAGWNPVAGVLRYLMVA
jgi:hypothetical protein